MAEHLHDGHRQRMRARFLLHGAAGFNEHELLEMLLFYAIPRVNTNELAHRLLETFGSLHAVLCAAPEALRQVRGVTENTVVLLQMLPAVYLRCMPEQHRQKLLHFADESCAFFRKAFLFDTEETLRLAFLDEELHICACEIIQQGSVVRAEASVEEIVRHCAQRECRSIILAHNHMIGSAKPSPNDIASTHQLHERLAFYDICLMDHIIVTKHQAVSMRRIGAYLFHPTRR